MSERRWDPTAAEWVTFATHRQDRMYKPSSAACPLCPTRDPDEPTEIPVASYEIAVFDNRFPSMSISPPRPDVTSTDLYPVRPAFGRCEVISYSDRHEATLAELPSRRVRMLVDVWADRYQELGSMESISYVMPFENKGEVIGVTLSHPHGQVYAYPDIPPRPARELRAAREHHAQTGRCVECDVVAAERSGARVVVRGDFTIAFVPFWARFPFEVHVVPLAHAPRLADLGPAARDDFADVLHRVIRGYDLLFGFSLPYVMALHARPTDASQDWDPISHLHVEFAPPHRAADKLKYLAGSELAGGAFVTDVAPERAASQLRECMT